MEVAAGIVDVGVKLKEPADATDADGEEKIPQSAAQPKCPPEAGDEMSALSRLEQNVTFVELNHKAKAPLNAVRFSHSERCAYNAQHYTKGSGEPKEKVEKLDAPARSR